VREKEIAPDFDQDLADRGIWSIERGGKEGKIIRMPGGSGEKATVP